MGLVAGPLTSEQEGLIDLIDQRLESAATARQEHLDDALQCHAFYRGRQWTQYSNGKPLDLRERETPAGRKRIYAVVNKLRPIARKHISRALAAQVGVQVAPLTPRPIDAEAAAQARALLSHFGRAHKDEAMTLRAVTRAAVMGMAAVLDYWNPRAVVPLPVLDAAGQIADVEDREAGDVCAELIEIQDIYPDPKARSVQEMNWLIIASWRPLSWIQSQFEEGRYVDSEGLDGYGASAEVAQRTRAITGDRYGQGEKGAVVKYLYEVPSIAFPQGRYVIGAGKRILHEGPFPYGLRDEEGRPEFPLTFLAFDEGIATLWSGSPLLHLIDLQRQYNRLHSRIAEHTGQGYGKILAPRGAEIAPNSFKSEERDEVIYYNADPKLRGMKPELFPHAPLDPALPGLREMIEADMGDIGEVQDVSKGEAPYAAAPAAAIEALLAADASSSKMFLENLRTFTLARARKRLKLAEQYYVEPRLIAVQDAAPEDPAFRAASFADMAKGRYVLTASVSTPRPPHAKLQMMVDLAAQGMLEPDRIPVTILFLQAQGLIESNREFENLLQQLRQMQEEQRAADAEAATEPESVRSQSRLAEIEAQTVAEQSRADHQHALEMETAERELENELLRAGLDHEAQGQQQAVQYQHDAQMAKQSTGAGKPARGARR